MRWILISLSLFALIVFSYDRFFYESEDVCGAPEWLLGTWKLDQPNEQRGEGRYQFQKNCLFLYELPSSNVSYPSNYEYNKEEQTLTIIGRVGNGTYQIEEVEGKQKLLIRDEIWIKDI